MINARSIATLGIGFGARAISTIGYWVVGDQADIIQAAPSFGLPDLSSPGAGHRRAETLRRKKRRHEESILLSGLI